VGVTAGDDFDVWRWWRSTKKLESDITPINLGIFFCG
jgi:hypothetical protein